MFAGYSASLTSKLSTQKIQLPFSTPEGLDADSQYHIVTSYKQTNAIFEAYFSKSPEGSAFHNIYYNKILNHEARTFFPNLNNAINQLSTEPNAVLFAPLETFESRVQLSFEQGARCNFSVAWKSNYPGLLSLVFPKGSPYLEFFTYYILLASDDGILDYIIKKWSPRDPSCSTVSSFFPFGMEKCGGLMVVLAGSLLAGILICIMEKAYSYVKENNISLGTRRNKLWKFTGRNEAFLTKRSLKLIKMLQQFPKEDVEETLRIINGR